MSMVLFLLASSAAASSYLP